MVLDMSKPAITLAFVGPKGSGKTTVAAHLCRLLGGFEEADLAECKDLSKELGNPDGQNAWMLDRLTTERELGSTKESSFFSFQSDAFRYSAVDTRGDHLLHGMMKVTTLVDVALLVVSAAAGEYEASIDDGRVRELALACFNMGIKNIIVLVTKMDDPSVDYSMGRFDEVKQKVSGLLKDVGYKQKEPPFVPVSGLAGGSLTTKSPTMPWHGGKPVIDTLDEQGPMNRPAEKPLRIPVFKVRKVPNVGTVLTGRVEAGTLRPGIKVLLAPSGQVAEVASIQVAGQQASEAKGGDIASFCLGDVDAQSGMVISSASEDPASDTDWFQAQIRVLDHPGTIRAGYCPSIVVGTAQVPCEFEELVAKIDKKTGKETETNPDGAKADEIIMAKLRPRAPIVTEAFSAYPPLGRFVVRDHGRTVAVGVVKKAEKRPVPKTRSGNENQYFDQ